MRSKQSPQRAHRVGPEVAIPETAELEGQPISRYLRRQRELRGISVEELSNLTRIPLRSLQRLESGSFDDAADGFVRGFVRTVAEALGLDPGDTVSRMLSEPHAVDGPQFEVSNALPTALVLLASLVLLGIAAGAVRFVTSESHPPVAGVSSAELVYRLDPVRALAESQAALPAPEPAPVQGPALPPEMALLQALPMEGSEVADSLQR